MTTAIFIFKFICGVIGGWLARGIYAKYKTPAKILPKGLYNVSLSTRGNNFNTQLEVIALEHNKDLCKISIANISILASEYNTKGIKDNILASYNNRWVSISDIIWINDISALNRINNINNILS